MCVNRSGPGKQSPAAKMSGFAVRSIESVAMPPSSASETPARLTSRVLVFGTRPVELINASETRTCRPPSGNSTVHSYSPKGARYRPPSPRFTCSERVDMTKTTPSRSMDSRTRAAAASSSFPMIRGKVSMTVTWLPSRCIACASSSPMGPAPMTVSLAGSSSKFQKFPFVRCSTPFSGGMTLAAAPVATTHFRKASSTFFPPPASRLTARGPAKAASPVNTSTPTSSVYLLIESCLEMSARTALTRPITPAKSTRTGPSGRMIPSSELVFTNATRLAAASSAFEGTQPVLRQSPPV
mmetsp:Transcript_1659/g.3979  ORF Transcript_1659/g.3979 Transcript_1659/m.3979 type:complete len:297 (+) Transcript_1659:1411-2301(+)